jgi:HAD superfamily hydrolase (TIGR01509 family)
MSEEAAVSEIKAICFDQDGVIIDTEKDGHRVAFNETFEEFGFDVVWDEEGYHQLLQIGGGKERMKHYLETRGFGKEVDPTEAEELIRAMHSRKTARFVDLIESGRLPLRPGVRRFMQEGMEQGLALAICTTANERSARAVVDNYLDDIQLDVVLAGDMVTAKKPDPEIYERAASMLGVEPENCVVVEDSRNGVLAARAAGMRVVATTNHYTEREDLGDADVIVTCLGEIDGERGSLTKGDIPDYDGVLHVEQVMGLFEERPSTGT